MKRNLIAITLLSTAALLLHNYMPISKNQVNAQSKPKNELTIIKSSLNDRVKSDTDKLKKRLLISRGGVNEYTKDYKFNAILLPKTEVNIQQTKSIISPYTGTVLYYIKWYSNGEFIEIQHILANYEYKNDAWVLKLAKRSTSSGYNEDASEVEWAYSLFK